MFWCGYVQIFIYIFLDNFFDIKDNFSIVLVAVK